MALSDLFLEQQPALTLFGGSAVPPIDQITQAVPFNVFEQFDWLLRSKPEFRIKGGHFFATLSLCS